MVVALLSPVLDWTLFAVFMVLCFAVGTGYMTRYGGIDVFGAIDSGTDALFIIALFVVVMAVVSPFVALWALGHWMYRRFSAEVRRKHSRGGEQIERARQARRLLASKRHAAARNAASGSGAP